MHATPLMLQQVNLMDGVSFIGDPVQILDNNGAADDGIVEAPYIVKAEDGTYMLFFNSGLFTQSNYAIHWATAQSVTGPYQRQGVLLKTGDYGLTGPGGLSVGISSGGVQRQAVFHAGPMGQREMYDIILNIQGNSVSVA